MAAYAADRRSCYWIWYSKSCSSTDYALSIARTLYFILKLVAYPVRGT